jgi:hypothetical protein
MRDIKTCIHCTDFSENKLMLGAQTLRKIKICKLPSQKLPKTYLYFAHKNSPKLNNFYT